MKFLTKLIVIIFIAISSVFDTQAATVYLGVGESYETVVDDGVGYSYIGIESVTCDNPSVYVEKIGLKVRATVKAYFSGEATVKTTIRYKLYPSQSNQYRYHTFTIACKSNGGGNEGGSDGSFWLVETIMDVEIGQTKQLHYNFYNNDYAPITWSSDDTSIAQVDDSGKVTGVSKGTTYVRAHTTNGRSSSCKITVIDQLVWKDGDVFIVSPYGLPNLKCQIISAADKTCRLGAKENGGLYNGLYGGIAFYDKTLNLPSTVKAYDGTYFRIIEVSLLDTDLYPNIEKVILPKSVLKLDEGCFRGATKLKEVVLPELLSEIPDNTFAKCYSLVHVEIPDGVKRIGSSAFAKCYSLIHVEIPDGVKRIGSSAFADTSLKTFIMSENSQLTTVDNEAFSNCSYLEFVDFGMNIKEVGSDNEDGEPVFNHCNKLCEIRLPGKSVCNAANLFDDHAIHKFKEETIISVPETVLQAYFEHPYWKDFDKLYSIEQGDKSDYILIYFDSPYHNLSRTYRIFRNREVDGLIYQQKNIEIEPTQYFYFKSSATCEFFYPSDNYVIFSKDCDFVHEKDKINHKLKIVDYFRDAYFTLDNTLDKCFIDITIDLDEHSVVFSTDKSNVPWIHDSSDPIGIPYIVGNMNGWTFNDDWKLKPIEDQKIYQITDLNFQAGEEFKISDSGWKNNYSSDLLDMDEGIYPVKKNVGNMAFKNDMSNVSIRLDVSNETIEVIKNSGVDEIEIDDGIVNTEYYNLQGIRIEKPSSGMYIVKRGNKMIKKLFP